MLRGLLRLSAQPTMIAHFFNFVRMTIWEASVQKKSQIARPVPIPWNASAIFALLEFARRRLLLPSRVMIMSVLLAKYAAALCNFELVEGTFPWLNIDF